MTVTELNGSGKVSGSRKNQTGTRIFRVEPYTDWESFVNDKIGRRLAAGESETINSAAEKFSSTSRMRAMRYEVEGIGKPSKDANGDATYDGGAKVTIIYEVPAYALGEGDEETADYVGPYVTESLDASAEQYSYEKAGWEWSGDGVNFDEDDPVPGRIVPKVIYHAKRHRVPTLPLDQIFDYIGKVNSDLFRGAAVGTVLFLGATAEHTISPIGDTDWDIGLQFEYKREGHNKLLRASSGNFEACRTINGGNPLYESADLKDLIPERDGDLST